MKITITLPIKKFIMDRMQRLGMTQEILARRAGISKSIISFYVRDIRGLNVDTLEKILKVLK